MALSIQSHILYPCKVPSAIAGEKENDAGYSSGIST